MDSKKRQKQLKKTTVENETPKIFWSRKRILSGEMIKNFLISRKDRKRNSGSKKINTTHVNKEGRIVGYSAGCYFPFSLVKEESNL